MALQTIQHGQPNWDTPINDMFKELYEKTTNLDGIISVDHPNQNFTLTNGASVDGLGDGLRIWQVKTKGLTDIYGTGRVSIKAATTADRFEIKLPYVCSQGDYRDGSWFDWDNVSFQIEEPNSISAIHQASQDKKLWINFHIQRPLW